jgi:hypothetical protein
MSKRRVSGFRPTKRGARGVAVDNTTMTITRSGVLKAIATYPPVVPNDGSVTSVGLTATPTSVFNVSGSPVTTSGTLALSMDDQAANKVMAGPSSGADATPAFRSLVTADVSNDMITLPKIADIADQKLLGNNSGGAASPSEIGVSTNLEFSGSNIRHTASTEAAGKTYFPGGWAQFDAQGHRIDELSDKYSGGEGLVTGLASVSRGGTSLVQFYRSDELDKVFITTSAVNGLLQVVDPITKEQYTVATYTSKALGQIIYSPHASSLKLYIHYANGNSAMSVNPSGYAIVTSGIAKNFGCGAAIRTSDGVLYGCSATSANTIIRINTASDTAGSDIAAGATWGGSSRKNIAYCPDNDSMYYGAQTKIGRIPCTTNTPITEFSPAGLTGASGNGSTAYSARAARIFVCCQGALNLVKVNPNSDTQEAAYAFPPGYTGSGGQGMVCLGRYLYIGGNGSSPSEILIFDTDNNVFVGCLNTPSGTATTGLSMAGTVGTGIDDTFLYTAQSTTTWYYWGGR